MAILGVPQSTLSSWLKKGFGLSDRNFRVRIHAYPDTDTEKAISFWMKELDICKDSFYPFSIDKRTGKSQRNSRVLPYGTAHLSVVSNGVKDHGVLLHRKILATIDRVLNMRD